MDETLFRIDYKIKDVNLYQFMTTFAVDEIEAEKKFFELYNSKDESGESLFEILTIGVVQ